MSIKGVLESLEGKKMKKSIFSQKTQYYKVFMTMQYLNDNNIISFKGYSTSKIGRGKRPYIYELSRSRDEIIKWIDKVAVE